MTRRMTKQEQGRAMRLAGAGFGPSEVAEAVGCSFRQAQTIVRERNRRVRDDSPLWCDRGDYLPPPETARRQRKDDNRRTNP